MAVSVGDGGSIRVVPTHKHVALTLIAWATAVKFWVDTIVKLLVCLPRVSNECNNLLCLEKVGSSLKPYMSMHIEYNVFRFCFFICNVTLWCVSIIVCKSSGL